MGNEAKKWKLRNSFAGQRLEELQLCVSILINYFARGMIANAQTRVLILVHILY